MNDRNSGAMPGPIVTDLDPLIVTAPVIRSGTTLVQRLLCSSRSALIFGELVAQDLEFFLNLYAFKTREYGYHREFFSHAREQVLSGDANDWIPDLMPDVDEYLAALAQGAFAGMRSARDQARRLGRPVWGCKHPGWKPAFIRLLRSFMPRARFVVVTRDLAACARSARAQHQLGTLPEFDDFCRAWSEGMEYWQAAAEDPAVLLLSYEELITSPDSPLSRLGEFASVDDIQPGVLLHKTNTWTGDKALLEARDGYVPPAELSEPEQALVEQTMAAWEGRAQIAA